MEKEIKDSILAIIEKVAVAVEARDVQGLSRLSNNTIHCASIFQDADSLSFAIITYSLSKILSREKGLVPADDKTITKSFVINLRKIEESLKIGDLHEYNKRVANVMKSIRMLDKKTTEYIQEIMTKSKIKKGSAMFEHGISISRVSQVLGVSKWELMGYLGGKFSIDSDNVRAQKALKRLAVAESFFKVI